MNRIARPGSARRFLLAGFVVLLGGMTLVGIWVGKQVEHGVISRVGLVTTIYVDSFVSPHLQSLADSPGLRDADRAALDRLLTGTHLAEHVVALKIWLPDGRIAYSNNPALIGRQFPIKPMLATAFAGRMQSEIVDLDHPEHEFENPRWRQLVETYVPVRDVSTGRILAVSEFYQTTDYLEPEVRATRMRIWVGVGAVTLLMCALFGGLVRADSRTIAAQQRELSEKVKQLTALLAQNKQLHERVRRAAARTTALNEQFLRRIASDLHDGPAQGLSLALMRLDELADACNPHTATLARGRTASDEFRTLHSALQAASDELRAICKGLQLPELETLSLAETVQRAVRDYERKGGPTVALSMEGASPAVPLPVKFTLFRLIQESLANGFRHGGGVAQRVACRAFNDQLLVEISDGGKGFDPERPAAEGHLGLAGMRERVETLGGTFAVQSAPGEGTAISAALPIAALEPQS